MKTYWDLDFVERGKLTSEEVEAFLDAELMIKGVLRPRELKAMEPTPTPKPTRLKHTAVYLNGENASYVSYPKEIEVICEPVFTEDEFILAKPRLERSTNIDKLEKEAREEYEKALRLVEETTRGVWDDWAEQRKYVDKLNAVKQTYNDYLKTAEGDENMAKLFLKKVFSEELVKEALEQ